MEKMNFNKDEVTARLELIDNTINSVRNNPQGPLTGLIFGGLAWLWITIAIVLTKEMENSSAVFTTMGIALVTTLVSLGLFMGFQRKYRQSPLSQIDLIAKHIFYPLSFSPVIIFFIYQGGANSFGNLFNIIVTNISMIFATCLYSLYCIYKQKLIAVSSFIAFLAPIFFTQIGGNTPLPTLLLCLSSFMACFSLFRMEKSTTIRQD